MIAVLFIQNEEFHVFALLELSHEVEIVVVADRSDQNLAGFRDLQNQAFKLL